VECSKIFKFHNLSFLILFRCPKIEKSNFPHTLLRPSNCSYSCNSNIFIIQCSNMLYSCAIITRTHTPHTHTHTHTRVCVCVCVCVCVYIYIYTCIYLHTGQLVSKCKRTRQFTIREIKVSVTHTVSSDQKQTGMIKKYLKN
jgi:hypothetical protein